LRDDRSCRRFGASHTGSISGRVTTDKNQSGRSRRTKRSQCKSKRDVSCFLARPDRHLPFVSGLAASFKRPRDDERDGKSDDDCEHNEAHGPIWNFEKWKNLRGNLNQKPADDCVRDRDFVNVAPLEFGEKECLSLMASCRQAARRARLVSQGPP